MPVSQHDRSVLRSLAAQVAEIAALPVQQETIVLWKALNGLRPMRPMVAIHQRPWHELNVNDELTLRSEDEFCRGLETTLRRILYAWRHMPVDMVVEPVIEVDKVIGGEGFGIQVIERAAVLDPQNSVYGHAYIDQMQTEEDLKRIREPEIGDISRFPSAAHLRSYAGLCPRLIEAGDCLMPPRGSFHLCGVIGDKLRVESRTQECNLLQDHCTSSSLPPYPKTTNRLPQFQNSPKIALFVHH